ncbi:MAG: hypothetical protein KAJ91_03200 [Candidatus Aenigmarchaeota archaeon]|nr:hypothetical protein [Candidatus Aenigmarchaeota archaeon]
MDIEALLEKIRSESRKDIEKDLQEYEEKKNLLRKEYELKKASVKKQETEQSEKQNRALRNRMVSNEEVFWNIEATKKKRLLVDRAIKKGVTTFEKSKEYRALAESLIKQVPKQAKIHASGKDTTMQRLLSKKKLRAKPAEFSMGLAYSIENETTILSLESMLEKNRAHIENELCKVLFKG